MPKQKTPIDLAIDHLAVLIAHEHYDFLRQVYADEAEFLAEEGVTKSQYLKNGIETVADEWYEVGLEDKLVRAITSQYRKILKER